MGLTFYTMLDFQFYFLISYFFKYVPTSCIKKVIFMGNLLTLTLLSLGRGLLSSPSPKSRPPRPNPNPKTKAVQNPKVQFGLGLNTKIPWATHPTNPWA